MNLIHFSKIEYVLFHIQIQPPEFPNDSIYVNLYYFQLIDAVTGYCDLNFSKSNLVTNENNFLQDFLKYICEDDLGDDLPGSQIELKVIINITINLD